MSNATRAVQSRGYGAPSLGRNDVCYWTMASQQDAVDFGDMIQVHRDHGSGGNSTRGIFCGGSGSSDQRTNVIDFITIATLGNSIDFGDNPSANKTSQCASASSPTRMVTSGGKFRYGHS